MSNSHDASVDSSASSPFMKLLSQGLSPNCGARWMRLEANLNANLDALYVVWLFLLDVLAVVVDVIVVVVNVAAVAVAVALLLHWDVFLWNLRMTIRKLSGCLFWLSRSVSFRMALRIWFGCLSQCF